MSVVELLASKEISFVWPVLPIVTSFFTALTALARVSEETVASYSTPSVFEFVTVVSEVQIPLASQVKLLAGASCAVTIVAEKAERSATASSVLVGLVSTPPHAR